jgi:hypothetical protein
MPIRINLLAEQQAEEEARRRDPVKRAGWVAGVLIALMLLWCAQLQFRLGGLRSDLADHEGRWKRMGPEFLQISNDFQESGMIRKKLNSLQKYATNRFLWANALDALQQTADDQVRVATLTGTSVLTEQKPSAFSTNLFVTLPPKHWWSWKSAPPATNAAELAQALLGVITNKPEFVRYQSALKATLNVTTNPIQIVAKVDVIKPETVTEKITLNIRARDYGNPPGKRVDRFYETITNTPYFKSFIGRSGGSVQPDSIQPRDDRTDLISPTDLYIPFTIELSSPERIRSND